MRHLLTLAIALYISCSAFAQTSDAETEAVINLLGVQKREAVSKMVMVSSKDSAAFWKIYDEYQAQNKANAKERIKLYQKTAEAYGTMNEKVADSLASAYFTNRVDQEKTLQSYFKKIKTATNSVTAFEFYQAEVYLLTQIRAQIMSQIPTYGELMRASKK